MREGARHRPGRKSTAGSPAGLTSSVQGAHDFKTAVAGLRGEVRFKAPLKDFTSFRIGGPADVLVIPADLEDLCRLMRQVHAAKVPLFVIGGSTGASRSRTMAIRRLPGRVGSSGYSGSELALPAT